MPRHYNEAFIWKQEFESLAFFMTFISYERVLHRLSSVKELKKDATKNSLVILKSFYFLFYWQQEKSRIYDTIFYFSFLFSFLVMQHIKSNLLSVRQKIIIFTVLYFNSNKNLYITNKKLYISEFCIIQFL